MINNQPENPPAFPIAAAVSPMGDLLQPDSWGMTLRDYFAAAALPVVVKAVTEGALTLRCLEGEQGNGHAIARAAYEMAGAMLKARG